MQEVVEFSNYLSVFLFELPDPNEELSYQYPNTFELFPSYPSRSDSIFGDTRFHVVPTLSSTALTNPGPVSEFDTRLRLLLALE